MELEKLPGKIAADKNNRKLGKVIKLENIEDKKTKIAKPHLLVHVKQFLRRDVVIVVNAEKVLKSDYQYVWFDILKEDFDQEVRETRALIHLYGKD